MGAFWCIQTWATLPQIMYIQERTIEKSTYFHRISMFSMACLNYLETAVIIWNLIELLTAAISNCCGSSPNGTSSPRMLLADLSCTTLVLGEQFTICFELASFLSKKEYFRKLYVQPYNWRTTSPDMESVLSSLETITHTWTIKQTVAGNVVIHGALDRVDKEHLR